MARSENSRGSGKVRKWQVQQIAGEVGGYYRRMSHNKVRKYQGKWQGQQIAGEVARSANSRGSGWVLPLPPYNSQQGQQIAGAVGGYYHYHPITHNKVSK